MKNYIVYLFSFTKGFLPSQYSTPWQTNEPYASQALVKRKCCVFETFVY